MRVPRRVPPQEKRQPADNNDIEALLREAAEVTVENQASARALHRNREEAATERLRKTAADDEAPSLAPRRPSLELKAARTTAEAKVIAQKKKTQDRLVEAFTAAISEKRDTIM